MRRPEETRYRASVVLGVAALTTLAASIGIRAQAPARPMVPVAASSVVRNPDAFYGENVSLMATVDQALSKTAFSVDQDKSKVTDKNLLVIAPYLSATVELNAYVTVVGEVVRFDPDEIAKKAKGYTLDLPADVVAKYRGRPAILATSVITADLTDVAKKPLPPVTPADEMLSKIMKQVSSTSTTLRASADASNVEQVKQGAAILRKSFSDVQAFFKSRGTTDAAGWAGDALKFVDATDTAAAAGKWDEAKTAAASITPLCAQCHAAHRERMDDGSFRLKGQ